jgi:hypothetical protein
MNANTQAKLATGMGDRLPSEVGPPKNRICLWYDSDALGAANFYAATFPDSSVGAVHLAQGKKEPFW